MRPLMYALAATLLILQAGCATHRHPARGQSFSPDQLARELNLTGQQQEQVGRILDQERAEREQMRESGAQMSRESRREQMHAVRSELIEKLSAVLTPAQLQKFEELEQQRRHHRRGFEGYGSGPPGQ